MKKSQKSKGNIADNRKAFHDYFIEERFEAGLCLQGWEVKSLREGRAQISQSYVIIRNAEAWLVGSLINPLKTASTHIDPDPQRTRKLLLNRKELSKLIGKVEQKGYTLVALNLHWRNNWIKLEVGLAKGKKLHDKRATEKERDWNREKQRLLKKG